MGPSAEEDVADELANARFAARRDDVRRWYGSRSIVRMDGVSIDGAQLGCG